MKSTTSALKIVTKNILTLCKNLDFFPYVLYIGLLIKHIGELYKYMAIFCVDYDGTLVEDKFPEIGKEKKDGIRVLKRLQEEGHKIIIWTCRSGKYLEDVKKWCWSRHFNPDRFNENYKDLSYAWPKVYADVYLDDKSFPPFTNWLDVETVFCNRK